MNVERVYSQLFMIGGAEPQQPHSLTTRNKYWAPILTSLRLGRSKGRSKLQGQVISKLNIPARLSHAGEVFLLTLLSIFKKTSEWKN